MKMMYGMGYIDDAFGVELIGNVNTYSVTDELFNIF